MSNDFYPEQWQVATLGASAEVKSGVGFPKKFQGKTIGKYPVYKVGDVSIAVTEMNGKLSIAGHYVSESEAKELKGEVFRVGATLFAKIGEAVKLNRRALVKREGLADNNVMAVIPVKPNMDKFIHHFLRTVDLTDVSRSTTIPSIRKGDIEDLEIVYPPLAEQKVIADKLDTLLAQVESTKVRLERIPQILKRFRQSVLAAAVSGKLTEEWREINIPGEWKNHLLKDLCRSISDGDHQAPPRADKGIPFLVISNVSNRLINFDEVSRWVPTDYYNSLKAIRKPENGDILYTVTGSFGIPVIVNTDEPFCFQRHIAIIKPDHEIVDFKFLSIYLGSPTVFKHAEEVATGTAQKTVSLNNLRTFEINVPTRKEQTEIVRRVEQLFAYADTIEQQVQNALARVNNLTPSILAKAFRGELTEQWRKDNPDLISGDNSAEALLEKIKAEREAIKPEKKTQARKMTA